MPPANAGIDADQPALTALAACAIRSRSQTGTTTAMPRMRKRHIQWTASKPMAPEGAPQARRHLSFDFREVSQSHRCSQFYSDRRANLFNGIIVDVGAGMGR
jgi:hypothetical protein